MRFAYALVILAPFLAALWRWPAGAVAMLAAYCLAVISKRRKARRQLKESNHV